MKGWIQVTLILCAFGFLRETRPSEPFVSEFLLGEWRNITEEQLIRNVYPIGTYSYLSLLVVVFLITDFLRFKPVIILSGLSGITVYAILLWTTSLEWLQASQFFYGLYMATEVAYFTYIYAQVDPTKYPQVSSYTRVAALSGRFVSGVSSQLLVYFHLMDYRDLNYITFTAQILATLWAFGLPSVQFSIYFHRNTDTPTTDKELQIQNSEQNSIRSNIVEAATLISRHARAAYSRPKVIAWSILYAVALALFVQVQTYVQLLWKQIQEETDMLLTYNGAVEAAQTVLGAGGAFFASVYSSAGVAAPVVATQAAALFLATFVSNVFVSYAGYIVVGMLFHYTITLASAKIASQLLDESCFGLIFGMNTLAGTALQSLLTYVLLQALQLPISVQYYCVSALYATLAGGWLLAWLVHNCHQTHNARLNN